MVRRWSHIIDFNSSCTNFFTFRRMFRLEIFRSSVYYKRFVIKITKFKRKKIARWKHRSNWTVYTNVIKTWVENYRFMRQVSRYQFFEKSFIQCFHLYEFNYIKVRHARLFSTFTNILTIALSKNVTSYFLSKNFKINSIYLKNSNFIKGFLIPSQKLDNEYSTIPLLASHTNALYPASLHPAFDFNSLLFLIFQSNLKQITELYKILVLLFYNILLKR